MLGRDDDGLPPRVAALARFATTLTAEPWALSGEVTAELAAQGFGADAVEAATGVVAMFNYLTRVADATGIEFDYASPLPAFEPDLLRVPVPRPERSSWPSVPAEFRTFERYPALSGAWQRWRGYLLDSEEPLTRRVRLLLAGAAAQECCDGWRADLLAGYQARDEAEATLVRFARALSRQPWRMQPADLDGLRALGYSEIALLHVIAVVAHQNAESRLAMGRAVLP